MPSYITLRRILSICGVQRPVLWSRHLAQEPRQPFSRVAVTVTPDHPDWTYQPGEAVTFRIDVLRDGHQVGGATVKYGVGPEMLPTVTQATAVVGTHPLMVAGGTLKRQGSCDSSRPPKSKAAPIVVLARRGLRPTAFNRHK